MRTLLAVLLLLPASAVAQHKVATFGITSRTSCGQFVAALEGHPPNTFVVKQISGVNYWSEDALMMEYVFGFLTAVNVRRDHDHQIQSDNPSLVSWFRNWCTKNPTRRLLDAVDAFTTETPGAPAPAK